MPTDNLPPNTPAKNQIRDTLLGREQIMTYGGELSFLRRKYSRDLTGVDVAISGIPFDNAVTYRSGARLGPRAIRQASVQLSELKAFPFGFDPFDIMAVVDMGDCHLNPHRQDTVIASIFTHIATILAADVIPISFGGDHFVTYPILKAIHAKFGPVALLHFYAHSDTWEDDGHSLDHGTMFLRAKQEGLIDVSKSCQVGIRTHNDSDHGFQVLTAPWVWRNGADTTLTTIKQRIGNHKVYITFDIDCLDPAFAPGTGTPVSGGLDMALILSILRGLDTLNIVGADVVEVAPAYDISEITAIAAATIAHDYICLLARQRGLASKENGYLY